MGYRVGRIQSAWLTIIMVTEKQHESYEGMSLGREPLRVPS